MAPYRAPTKEPGLDATMPTLSANQLRRQVGNPLGQSKSRQQRRRTADRVRPKRRDGRCVPHVRPVRAAAAEGDGIILGIAVLLDALLVRLMLVPILLRLSGRFARGCRGGSQVLPGVRFGH